MSASGPVPGGPARVAAGAQGAGKLLTALGDASSYRPCPENILDDRSVVSPN